MQCPDKLQLRRADGEALRTRLARDRLTADNRRVLDQGLQGYVWLLLALQEATVSLKRLRVMVVGETPKKRQEPSAAPRASAAGARGAGGAQAPGDRAPAATHGRAGHGRQGAESYRGAAHVVCHHETLAAGERGPVCGRRRLERVEPGVAMRLDGHALRSAVR
jgi:hypothetical protein